MRKLHVPTPAQEWARKRNWNKRVLRNIRVNISTVQWSFATTPAERTILKKAEDQILGVLRRYSGRNPSSKSLYLKTYKLGFRR